MVDVYLYPVTVPAGADVWLRPFTIGPTTIELSPSPVILWLDVPVPFVVRTQPPVAFEARDDKPEYAIPAGVKARSLYLSLLNRYGSVEGARIYAAMQAEAKGPFAPGAKHHDAHVSWAEDVGVEPIRR